MVGCRNISAPSCRYANEHLHMRIRVITQKETLSASFRSAAGLALLRYCFSCVVMATTLPMQALETRQSCLSFPPSLVRAARPTLKGCRVRLSHHRACRKHRIPKRRSPITPTLLSEPPSKRHAITCSCRVLADLLRSESSQPALSCLQMSHRSKPK